MEPQTLGLSFKSEGIRILDSGSGLVSVLGTKVAIVHIRWTPHPGIVTISL